MEIFIDAVILVLGKYQSEKYKLVDFVKEDYILHIIS